MISYSSRISNGICLRRTFPGLNHMDSAARYPLPTPLCSYLFFFVFRVSVCIQPVFLSVDVLSSLPVFFCVDIDVLFEC